jgi:hypothetical protein
LVSGRASTRASDALILVRCWSLMLTEALTLVPEDCAAWGCAFGCCAVLPAFGVLGVCAWLVLAGAGLDVDVELDEGAV